MDYFLKISGDNNPLHTDRSYAQNNGFFDRVVYGMLTASFYSTLVGVYLPGKYCILHSMDIQFSKPVFVGDELVISGVVASINQTFQQLEIKASIHNQDAIKVSRAKIKVGVVS
jgi:3-hydroxybutyryl-CoA dehydratase